MLQNRPKQLYQQNQPDLGCACSSSLGGWIDDLKSAGESLLEQGQKKAVDAAKPYLDEANKSLDKLDMALKIIIGLSAIAALTGVINLKKRR